jgi:sugar phosphate isomerase/epimerase
MAVNWVSFADEPAPLWPLETILDAVAAAGFTSVGLDHYTLGAYTGTHDDLAAQLRERGLRCSDVGIVAVGELDAAAVERLARTAVAVQAPLCIAALYRDVSHAEAVRDLRAAAEILSPCGVRMAFEFTSYGARRSLADAVAICDDVGWEACGLLVDAWHVFRGGESLADVAALGGGRIALVHFDDGAPDPHADPTFDGRFRRLLPGSGSFDLAAFAAALDAAGYRGPVAVEVLSAELRRLPPAEGARQLRESVLEARLVEEALRCRSRPARAYRGRRRSLRPRRSS